MFSQKYISNQKEVSFQLIKKAHWFQTWIAMLPEATQTWVQKRFTENKPFLLLLLLHTFLFTNVSLDCFHVWNQYVFLRSGVFLSWKIIFFWVWSVFWAEHFLESQKYIHQEISLLVFFFASWISICLSA